MDKLTIGLKKYAIKQKLTKNFSEITIFQLVTFIVKKF